MKEQTEKQAIEEMAQDLNMLNTLQCDFRYSINYQRAKGLYSLGYRKQSEGEWKSGKTQNGQWGYYCSICAASFVGENAEWIAKEHDYCPKCGAKMKGGAE